MKWLICKTEQNQPSILIGNLLAICWYLLNFHVSFIVSIIFEKLNLWNFFVSLFISHKNARYFFKIRRHYHLDIFFWKFVPNKPLSRCWWLSNVINFISTSTFSHAEPHVLTHLFINESINFLQRFAVHIIRKWFKFLWQHITIFDSGLVSWVESILSHQLNVAIFVFDLRFLCVGNNLLFGNCK